MDTPKPNAPGDQPANQAAPVNPAPSLEPKVFDLSSINSVNQPKSSFKKKPIIFGVLSLLLVVGLLVAGALYFRQPEPERTGTETKAYGDGSSIAVTCSGEKGQNISSRLVVHTFSSKAALDEVKNSDDPNRIPQLVGMRPPPGCEQPGNYCIDGSSCTASGGTDFGSCENTATIPDCSLAQLDCMDGSGGGNIQFNSNGCDTQTPTPTPTPTTTPPPFSCLKISGPAGAVIPGQIIELSNSTTGSTGTWQSTWSVTSSGADTGQLTNVNYNTTKWTVPANPVSGQTWAVKVTVKDKSGAEDTKGCTTNFSYSVTTTVTPTETPTTTTTPTATPATYKTCENNACVEHQGVGTSNCNQSSDCAKTTHKACVNNACVEVQGAGSDSCSSDASCQPAAAPPPIPESGNTALTLVGIITGLTALGAALFLAL